MNTTTRTTRKPLRTLFAAAAVLAALATGARADDVQQVHVHFADLNLATDAGATLLYQRIRHAANQVCGTEPTRELKQLVRFQTCTDHAVAAAVATVNVPKLTALFDAKLGIERKRINLAAR